MSTAFRVVLLALINLATAGTSSVHRYPTPKSTCRSTKSKSLFGTPYEPSMSPLARTRCGTSGSFRRTSARITSPTRSASSAVLMAASTEHRRASSCPGWQLVMNITGYKPCSVRMCVAASGSKVLNATLRLGCDLHTARVARSSMTIRAGSTFLPPGKSSGVPNFSSKEKPKEEGALAMSSCNVGISSSTSMIHGAGASVPANLRYRTTGSSVGDMGATDLDIRARSPHSSSLR
mmetsp:Transcript_2989/g.11315  ORF Transcript_2989/g.11315 Transcript_2989/m.11315 type:complete len:235 (-) Transcript_2989:260-964(-)